MVLLGPPAQPVPVPRLVPVRDCCQPVLVGLPRMPEGPQPVPVRAQPVSLEQPELALELQPVRLRQVREPELALEQEQALLALPGRQGLGLPGRRRGLALAPGPGQLLGLRLPEQLLAAL